MEEQVQQFQVEWSQSHSFRSKRQFSEIMKNCKQVQIELVHQFLLEIVDRIIENARNNYLNEGERRVIITVQFLKNQVDQFPIFLKMITEKFENDKFHIFSDLPPEKVDVVFLMKKQVREIVLNIYIYLEENPQIEFVVFIANEITDLDEFNMYCFQKGLRRKKLMLIISSHQHFEPQKVSRQDEFVKLHYQLYRPKERFSQYVYRCMTHPIIRPYLPPEILRLITDMDYYTISYHQSCRRFQFCVERGLMLYKKQRTYVQFDELINTIDLAIKKQFKIYVGGQRPTTKERLIKIILTQNESFHISERDMIFQIAMRTNLEKQVLIDQNILITCMRDHVKNALRKNDKFKKYQDYLEDKPEPEVKDVGRKKRSRSEMLGIDTRKNLTPKLRLQTQITRIIKEATALIRQQASHIRWEDINYELRIKPQLPYLIKQAWQADEEASQLVQQITKNYSTPLTTYLRMYDKQTLGKAIYLIKCLELAGIIEIKKSQIKPIVYTHYFEKANFKVLS